MKVIRNGKTVYLSQEEADLKIQKAEANRLAHLEATRLNEAKEALEISFGLYDRLELVENAIRSMLGINPAIKMALQPYVDELDKVAAFRDEAILAAQEDREADFDTLPTPVKDPQ